MGTVALDHVEHAAACDAIIAGLPGWFGHADGVADCAAAVRREPGFVTIEDGQVGGFLTWSSPSPGVAEITWMAVSAARRGHGVGTRLVDHLAGTLADEGVRLLLVKTLSDREDPGPEYSATRGFYLARGFLPVAELDIWGPENPCQLLARPV